MTKMPLTNSLQVQVKKIGRKLTVGKSNENSFGKKGLEHPYYYIEISTDFEL